MEKLDKESEETILLIAERIKTLRKGKGYSSYETFAFDYSINRVQYHRIEKGQNITLKTLINVLKIHNLTIQDFFKDL